MPERSILHLDMDAFYASVEQRDNPELRGRPVIVGGTLNRGVVSAASYEVRRFGVHSAMPMAEAVRRCPHAVVLPVRMGRYKEVSDRVFEIFFRFTPLVEPLSLDEAFLDVTGCLRLWGPPEGIARKIKTAVREETGLTVSAGVAPNKFLAKIASDLHKPDGLTIVPRERIQEFLDPLPVDRLWGLGRKTGNVFRKLGIRTISQLRQMDVELLVKTFGEQGRHFHLLAHGVDSREVEPYSERKSVGHEDTYESDLWELEEAKTRLLDLAERVSYRLRAADYQGGTITLKVKYSDFTLVTRSLSPGYLTDDGGRIYREVLELLAKTQVGQRAVRLLGISISGLVPRGVKEQLTIPGFCEEDVRTERLNRTLDEIRDRFGRRTVQKSLLLEERKPRRRKPGARGGRRDLPRK